MKLVKIVKTLHELIPQQNSCPQPIDSTNSHRLPSCPFCTQLTLHFMMGVMAPMMRELACSTHGCPLHTRRLKTHPVVCNLHDYQLIHQSRGLLRHDYALKTNDTDGNYNVNKTNHHGGLHTKATLTHPPKRRVQHITATICAPVD